MCLTLPAQVIDVAPDGATAVVEGRNCSRVVSLVVLAGDGVAVSPGDWLLLGAGLAVARIDADEAAELLALLDEASRTTP